MIRDIILIGWFVVNLLFKFSSRVSYFATVATLFGAGAFFMLGRAGFGLRIMTYAFGFFLIGTVSYLIEITKNEKVE